MGDRLGRGSRGSLLGRWGLGRLGGGESIAMCSRIHSASSRRGDIMSRCSLLSGAVVLMVGVDLDYLYSWVDRKCS